MLDQSLILGQGQENIGELFEKNELTLLLILVAAGSLCWETVSVHPHPPIVQRVSGAELKLWKGVFCTCIVSEIKQIVSL